jgi:hypothetical protein
MKKESDLIREILPRGDYEGDGDGHMRKIRILVPSTFATHPPFCFGSLLVFVFLGFPCGN